MRFVGVSTPEHDQNSVIELMKDGWVDVVQVIYNIFEQEPAAELLPAAAETGVGIIVRVVFDEGSLTGKWTKRHEVRRGRLPPQLFRGRQARARSRAGRQGGRGRSRGAATRFPQAAIEFALAHGAVSTVIPGMRNPAPGRGELRA